MSERILIIGGGEQLFDVLDELDQFEFNVFATDKLREAFDAVMATTPHIILLGEQHLPFLFGLRESGIAIPTIIIGNGNHTSFRQALDAEAVDFLNEPVGITPLQRALERGLKQAADQRRVEAFRTIGVLADMMASKTDLDDILDFIVQQAARLADAEEATLMLFSEETGQLSIRAAANVDQDPASIHQLVDDKIAMHVVLTGQPLMVNARPGQHVKTRYLVNNLLYTPLMSKSRPIGVLGVHNRLDDQPIAESRLDILETLSSYAASAIVYQREPTSANTGVVSGTDYLVQDIPVPMMILDGDNKLVTCNNAARPILNKGGKMNPTGYPINELTTYESLIELIELARNHRDVKGELSLNDSRVFQVNISRIEGSGTAVAMYDVTNLNQRYKSRGELINTMSHDLRSPLTAILSYVELMTRVGEMNERQLEFVSEVRRSVKTITTLLEEILQLERAEDGLAIQQELISMTQLLQEAAEPLYGKAQLKKMWFEVNLPENLPNILGNRVRLRQAFVNLMDNAIKYTPEGGNVMVTARHGDEKVFVHVTDNGIGIPAEDQPRIFDKFYRVDEAAESHDGTGLGLSLVKSIIESHEGRIWVESEAGAGSTFTVVLPAETVEESAI